MSKRARMNKQQPKEQSQTIAVAEPVKRQYAPPPCHHCANVREQDTNYTRVYKTERGAESVTRYCRCGFCGETWKDVRKN